MAFTHKPYSHKHDTVAEARECEQEAYLMEMEAAAELEAERRNERYFEEGPESFQAIRYAEEQEERRCLGY